MDEEGPDVNRRADARAPITLQVDYKRLNTFFADYTRNISRGGTFVRTDKPLEVGERFVFVLTIPPPPGGEPTRLELTGEVRWVVSPAEATSARPAGMGIQFGFADADERARLDAVVGELMRASLGDRLADKLLPRR